MDTNKIMTQNVEADKMQEARSAAPLQTNHKKSSSTWMLFILFFILSAAVGGGAYYFWQQQTLLQNNINVLADDLNAQLTQTTQQNKQHLNQQIALQNQRIAALKKSLKTLEDLSQSALSISKRGQRGWILAEVDYLLRLANRRLQVARDINGAMAALSSASERLYDLGDLKLFPVRQQLAKDIATLKNIKAVDVNGIAMALDQMSNYVGELPFKSVQAEIKAQVNNKKSTDAATHKENFTDSVISTIMRFGDIKVHQRSIQPASSAKQQQQYESILRTHILAARLSVLRNDQPQFLYETKHALAILQQYYQQDDNRIKQMQEDLQNFSQFNLSPDLPSLVLSWQLLNKLMIEKAPKPTEVKK